MNRVFRNQKGFTLIELVMVIVILAVLGAVAIPIYVDLRQEARDAAELGVAGGVQAGITTYFVDPARGNRAAYPPTLDAAVAAACATGNICFNTVLSQGGITSGWTKLTIVAPFQYRSPASATNVWEYTPATGSFVKTTV